MKNRQELSKKVRRSGWMLLLTCIQEKSHSNLALQIVYENFYFVLQVPLRKMLGYKAYLTLILRRSRTGTVWFYTSTSNKRAARPKLYTMSLTRDLKLMYNRLTLVRISINF